MSNTITIDRQAAIDAVKKNTFRLTFAEEQGFEGHVAWSAYAVYSDVMEGALLELPYVQSEQWIPCSERLPENKSYVLTTIYIPGRVPHSRSGWFEDGLFMNDNGDTWNSTDREVVAWMPLPEPYTAAQI